MKSILDIIWDFFRKPKEILIVKTEEITFVDVRELLKQYSDNLWISDGIFKLMDTNNLKSFLSQNPVNTRKYITEFHDCDDYSYELMGDVSTWNPSGSFGMVMGK